MTMEITRDQRIAGRSAKEVRDTLRKCPSGFNEDSLWDQGLTPTETPSLILDLITLGYIKPEGPSTYGYTRGGSSFLQASAAKRVTRAHAERALAGLMGRVQEVNTDPEFLHCIVDVIVFGSFIRGAESLGDVDIAYRTERKEDLFQGKDSKCVYLDHFNKTGKQYRHMAYEFLLPDQEIKVFLKNRQRTLSLHALENLKYMEKDANFSYQVLMGDEAKIAELLGTRRELVA